VGAGGRLALDLNDRSRLLVEQFVDEIDVLLRYRRLGALEGYYLPRLRQADGRVRDEGLVSIIVREGLHAAVGTVAEVLYRQNAGGAVVSLTMRDSPEEDMLNDSGAHDVHYGHAQGLRLHCR